MFKILNNPEATCGELADAYKQAAQAEQGLKIEQDRAYETLLNIQKNHLSDTKEAKQVKDARAAFETCKIKQEACLYGLGQLKTRMIECLPTEAEQRIDQIEAETETLLLRKNELHKEYLLAVAAVELALNKIEGKPLMYNKSTAEYVPGALRGVDFVTMNSDDIIFIQQAMAAKNAGEEPGLNLLLSQVWDEKEKIQKILAEPDPADGENLPSRTEKIEEAVEKLIAKA